MSQLLLGAEARFPLPPVVGLVGVGVTGGDETTAVVVAGVVGTGVGALEPPAADEAPVPPDEVAGEACDTVVVLVVLVVD